MVMQIFKYPEKNSWAELLKRPVMDNRSVDAIVLPILDDVKKRGDAALFEYTLRFDKVSLTHYRLPQTSSLKQNAWQMMN
jgi:histidinol dehydrogenase